MKYLLYISAFIFSLSAFSQNGDDGWDIRELDTYGNDNEPARISITLTAGFDTGGHDNFHAYIDPDLPLNGGIPVTDGEFNMNYIRQFTPVHDNATSTVPVHDNLNYSLWAENITYYDGLGRPIQKVAVKGTAAGTDLVQPIVYDNYGRIKDEYLPYAITQGGSDGAGGYRPVFLPEQKDFYSIYNPGEEEYTFAEKEFDGSPLNRVMKQGFAGALWNVETGFVYHYDYMSNSTNFEVYRFSVSSSNQLNKEGCYYPNKLFKKKTVGETFSIEYTDMSGNIVLKEVFSGINGYMHTYYVYDDFGLLRYVLPPKSYSYMPTLTTPEIFENTTDWILDLCYYYEYDTRKRIIKKRLPGSETVYMVYNKRDQLVLTQDGNQRANNEWLFTKYDVFNRPIMTGIYHSGASLGEMQSIVNSVSDYFEEVDFSLGHGYTNQAFPDITSAGCEVYTVTYYDDYNYIIDQYGTDYGFVEDEITFLYDEADNVKGQVTATKTKILENTEIDLAGDLQYLISVNYYDEYFRLIQKISDNHLWDQAPNSNKWCLDILSNQINFTGDILLTKEDHFNGTDHIIVETKYEYDNGKRLLKTKHRINNAPAWTTLNHSKYDELGRNKRTHIHGSSDNSLQTINYKYNIRNWITDINDINALGGDLFAMNLNYSYGLQTPHGNIHKMEWKSQMFGLSSFQFEYDVANRLTEASYSGLTGNDSHNTTYTYDLNGNIETLTRQGQFGTSSVYGQIDNLQYEYTGNQLKSVNDDSDDEHQANGFSDRGYFIDQEYNYDYNGNMTGDWNKLVYIPEYNYLNLPQKLEIYRGTTNKINYLYTAMGAKLRKQTKISDIVETTTDYIGNFVYEDNVLKYILTPEGRAMKNEDGTFEYQYFLKDYLGNTRVTFDQTGTVIQEDSYYPFGLAMSGLAYQSGTDYKNKYLYNGKELQDEFGLEWYDYGARYYDPQLGIWLSPDPLADERLSLSPYNYCSLNPINRIDPTGMLDDDYIFNEKGDYVRTDINNKPDKIVIENSTTGTVEGTYNFAYPSDTKAIDAGTINKVVFVDMDRIGKMLGEAGAFDKTNRENEWSYMNTESKGGGKLDFSYSAIPSEFAAEGASADPLTTPSPMLFIPEGDGNAHNHMNFGNFLWGTAGHSLGFSKTTLKLAAHYNSLFNSGTNGYPSQWDSSDDQFSIGRGVKFSNSNQFRNRTWSPTTGLSTPLKKR
jgi:RHS repeat-associated protein